MHVGNIYFVPNTVHFPLVAMHLYLQIILEPNLMELFSMQMSHVADLEHELQIVTHLSSMNIYGLIMLTEAVSSNLLWS
jgi:hypothetical protein